MVQRDGVQKRRGQRKGWTGNSWGESQNSGKAQSAKEGISYKKGVDMRLYAISNGGQFSIALDCEGLQQGSYQGLKRATAFSSS